MKPWFSILASCALAASSWLSAQAETAAYDSQAKLEEARADIANWMKYLPDNVFVAHVSIPGSHDSATGHNVSSPSISQAQEKTLDEQLEAGIRAFDFRPGIYGTGDDMYLQCNHGISQTKISFRDAMVKLTDYLKAHPTEFMAIHMFKANLDNNGDATKRATFNRLINEIFTTGELADYFIDFDPRMKVQDIRGKIVLFRRDKMAYADIPKAGNLGGWPGDADLWTPGTAAVVSNGADLGIYGRIRVTDVSSPNTQEKLDNEINSIKNLFAYNCSETRPNAAAAAGKYEPEWTMIFTSGEYKIDKLSGMKGYLKNATITNPLLTQLINEAEMSGPTGIVFSDWVLVDNYSYSGVDYETKGTELVTAIIENNFKYISEFILDDSLFKDDEEPAGTDLFGGKEYYFRNVATGRYLSAGADWGTHAVLADDGIRISPFFNKRTGEYLLKTTFKQNDVVNYLGENCYIDNTAFNPVRFVEAGAPRTYYIVFDGLVNEGETTRQATLALTPELTGNSYADGATMLIQNLEFAEGNTMQQWEVISEDELVKELAAAATTDDAQNLTFKLRGAHHRVNDGENNDAWTFTAATGTYRAKMEINGTNNWNDKEFIYRAYVGSHTASKVAEMHWTLEQHVAGLPDGVYTISLQALADNLPLDNEEVFSFTINGVDMREGLATNGTGKLTCAQALEKFRDESLNNCILSREIIVKGGTLDIVVKKGVMETNAQNAFFFDNVKLMYFGPEGLEAIDYTPADEYDTLILPFAAEIPAGLEVFSAPGFSEKNATYHVLDLVAQDAIEANTPYIVRYTAPAGAASDSYRFWGVKDAEAAAGVHTAGVLTGSHEAATVPAGAFALGRESETLMLFSRVDNDAAALPAGRAYIDGAAVPEAEVTKLHLVKPVSGIESVTADAEISADTLVDVYNVAGAALRSATPYAHALDGLDRGIYIVRAGAVSLKVFK